MHDVIIYHARWLSQWNPRIALSNDPVLIITYTCLSNHVVLHIVPIGPSIAYATQVDSAFRAFWLASSEVNSKWYLTSLSFTISWKLSDFIIWNTSIAIRYNLCYIFTFKKGWRYRSNSAQNAIPHDGCHFVQEVDGCCPWIHASGNNKLDSRFILVLQLEYKPSFQYYV